MAKTVFSKPLYEKIEGAIDPLQPIVYGILIVVILACLWLMVQPSHSIRTAGALWFLLP